MGTSPGRNTGTVQVRAFLDPAPKRGGKFEAMSKPVFVIQAFPPRKTLLHAEKSRAGDFPQDPRNILELRIRLSQSQPIAIRSLLLDITRRGPIRSACFCPTARGIPSGRATDHLRIWLMRFPPRWGWLMVRCLHSFLTADQRTHCARVLWTNCGILQQSFTSFCGQLPKFRALVRLNSKM